MENNFCLGRVGWFKSLMHKAAVYIHVPSCNQNQRANSQRAINNCCLFSSHIVSASDFFSDCSSSLSSALKSSSFIIFLLTNLPFLDFSFQQFTSSLLSLYYPNTFSDSTLTPTELFTFLLRACLEPLLSAYSYP